MSESIQKQIRHGLTCESGEKPHTVAENALCIVTHPGGMILRPFYEHYAKKYAGKYKFSRLVFTVDLLLIGMILGLALTALLLWAFPQSSFADKIRFTADVAPAELVSGAPSTLLIRYTNETGEDLHDVLMTIAFPAHFLLQEFDAGAFPFEDDLIRVGELPAGAVGTIRIRGVMFGDVGGEQTFETRMTFRRGEEARVYEKRSAHTFSPSSSTLALELTLPETLVAYQTVEGAIVYKNTGEIDFPEISLEPRWPDGFMLRESSVPQTNGLWSLPAISAGEEGALTFQGTFGGDTDSVTFTFLPSFTFGDARYAQEALVHTAPLIPPQISVDLNLDTTTAKPGGTLRATVRYENTGDTPVYDLVLKLTSDSPFVTTTPSVSIGTVEAGEVGETTIDLPLRSRILQSETSVYENLSLAATIEANYRLDSVVSAQNVVSRSEPVTLPITSPASLSAFGRYASETGDQLGRGPLPPLVGEQTKYWVFWNVTGTTNALTNVRISGTLAPGVVFTGEQAVSLGSGVSYDAGTGVMSWSAARLEPTFPPGSKILGIAFAVGLTPTDAMVGTTPTLISNVTLTGTDERTGAIVTAAGSAVTTNLPSDLLAAGLGVVEF